MIHAEMLEWTLLGQWMIVLSGGTATAVVLLKKKAMDVDLLETAGRASIRCIDLRYTIARFVQYTTDFEFVARQAEFVYVCRNGKERFNLVLQDDNVLAILPRLLSQEFFFVLCL